MLDGQYTQIHYTSYSFTSTQSIPAVTGWSHLVYSKGIRSPFPDRPIINKKLTVHRSRIDYRRVTNTEEQRPPQQNLRLPDPRQPHQRHPRLLNR
jgi:hypothetical protein